MPPSLPTAIFGRTGLKVTRLGFGAMEIRGPRIWGGRAVTDAEAETILRAVLDAGINFIDTANDYGRSEELIGRFLAGRRAEYVLATKCGCCVRRKDDQTDETPHVWTKANVVRGVDESLARLRTDVIDVMQLHNPAVEECQQDDLVAALQDLRARGKVRFVSISTTLPHLPVYLGWGVFDSFQIPYSGLNRDHESWITKTAEAGLGTVIRGGVQKGEPGAGLGNQAQWQKFEQANLDELRTADESRTSFLLRFTLSHPHVHTVIAGTLNPDHLRENVAAARRGPLPPDVYAEAKRRLHAAGVQPAA